MQLQRDHKGEFLKSQEHERMTRVGVGVRFKREEKYVYVWLIDIVVWLKPTVHIKAPILLLKNTFIKK